ncbi:hypothetical protein FAI40_04840 [Acetobacteraceae bacterium]|nr:hypothetical protein FAI40_04840 [Acetobacteraceae bacterium]
MIKKMAVAGIAASVLGFGIFGSHAADARGWGHHSSYSSPSSHASYHSAPHAAAPKPTAPMAPPAAAATKPSALGTIATTAAGTAGGVVAGNAISHAFEGGHGEGDKAQESNAQQPANAENTSQPVPVATDAGASSAQKGLPQATDPCTVENEQKSAKIEELCGQLHQEIKKISEDAKQEAAQK